LEAFSIIIKYYKDVDGNGNNRIKKTIAEIKKVDKELWHMIDHNLTRLKDVPWEEFLEEMNENHKKQHNVKGICSVKRKRDKIYYFRIPPQRNIAVGRIYFQIINEEFIYILEAERKTDKKPQKIDKAFKNLEEAKKLFSGLFF
jgi:hypothetical protein